MSDRANRGDDGAAVLRARKRIRWRPWLLLAVFAVLWFGFLELRGLYFPDEGRYSEIPREMLASGDWVTPRINGFPYFEKPPLQYWLTAAVFAVAGYDEWTARLAPAFVGFAGVLAVLWTARRLFGRRAGWMAGAVLGSSCGYFIATQFVTLDMLLTALLTCALCAFLLAQQARASPADNRRWMLVAWTLCALAVLTKGVIGVLLPTLAIGTYLAVTRDWRLMRSLQIGLGVVVLLVIAAPWFILVESRNPGFAEFFFIHEHWQRFTQPAHRRPGPFWYFLPIAVVFLMPWLPAIVASFTWRARGPASIPARAFSARTFAWCWAGAIFVFFSLSSSKLPAYIMPAMGAVALAAAQPLARRWDVTLRLTAWTLVACGVVVAGLAIPATAWIKVAQVQEAYADNVGWMIGAGALFVAGGALALHRVRGRRRLSALAAVALGGMLACQLVAVVAHNVDGYFSAERLIERVTEGAWPFRPDLPFYSVDMFDHTVPFYLGRRVILVKEKSELEFGIAAAPANYIADVATFAQRWRGDTDAYAIMRQTTYESLLATGLPMRLVDGDGRRVVVARR